MDKSVPRPAALLLTYIGKIEAPRGYDTIYGNNQNKLTKPITKMSLTELLMNQAGFTKAFGSSASGFYQIMRATLMTLIKEMKLSGNELFDADMQDRMGLHLLKRRGYDQYMRGEIDRTTFGRKIAQEWASFPVLAATKGAHHTVQRGQSYYRGDALNKALISPTDVEKVLDAMKAAPAAVPPAAPASTTKAAVTAACGVTAGGAAVAVAVEPSLVGGGAEAVVDGAKGAETILDQVTPITDTVSLLGSYGAYIAGAVVGLIILAFIAAALYKWARK